MSATFLVALAAVVVAPLVGYVTATRKLSGKIATSEAGQLWEESKAIRDDYRDRLVLTDTRTAALEARVAALEKLNNELMRENADLRERVSSLQVTLGREQP